MKAEIVSAIVLGDLDPHLDRLSDLIRQRKRTIANSLLYTLNPGDKVRLNEKTRPAYMRGMTGTVIKLNGSSASVQLDEGHGRFSGRGPTRVPSALLEKVSA